jgi:hypothetical protein
VLLARSFEAESEPRSPLSEPLSAASPNQSLDFAALALETRLGASEKELRKVYSGGFEAGFQSLETGSTLPETPLPIPRF